ncbi:3-deoxy-D-manno-octulosonic acid transferase [Desulfospira joergensenii]|uniref:3-deoxy-D-manno-octulosonic acid transferase n=1 Tax=Desulfospira joergensenii TaxID=53329 RepID=UPI0003B649A2|nr:glycosyltransferase N-terminal domain-containing protein [Desulfospira joergensenii]
MTKCAFIPNFFRFYNIMWRAVLPFLRRNRRLSPTFNQRLNPAAFPKSDIWIQAASAGEAFLALSILKGFRPGTKTRILVTTTTAQGMEILEKGLSRDSALGAPAGTLLIRTSYFPFDLPDIVEEVIDQISPRVMVLLETEIWPALFYRLKKNRIQTLILNARMSKKSFRHYRLTKFLWSALAPDRVLAISDPDALRYGTIFPVSKLSTMPNIKFDSMEVQDDHRTRSDLKDKLAAFLPGGARFSILASLRRQEEKQGIRMIRHLLNRYPDQVIGVFPRHMHRIKAWKKHLKTLRFDFILRSELENLPGTPLKKPNIILWDRFGEMRAAFPLASAVFVGGSLKPLGGQNFLEPVIQGAPTVTGPFWDDFSWVGQSLFDRNIVCKKRNWHEAAQAMVSLLENPPDRGSLRQKAAAYIGSRRGGTDLACQAILESLKNQG